jgi:beta-lactamase regulating signal transducer with metallopeptidase domain
LCGDASLTVQAEQSSAAPLMSMKTLLSNVAAIWNLILLLAVIGTLAGFFYWFGLRRLIRARRIASSRDRRMLREAAEREVNREHP